MSKTSRINKKAGIVFLALFSLLIADATAQNSLAHTNPVKEHSPRKALILSAVLPGAGQVYNKQAWKVPIVYAAIGGVAYYTYSNYTQMKLHKDEYLHRVANNDTPLDPDLATTPTANVYNLYQTYNKTFQLSVIISAALYGINLLDAYIFANLFDFQINDDLSLHLSPSLIPTHNALSSSPSLMPAASLSLHF